MSTATIVSLPDQSTARIPRMNFMSKEKGILSWLLTGDHKRIAMLYLVSITFFFFIGGALAGLIRLELLTPQSDLMATDTYNKVFSMHGIIMIFFFLVPSVPATIGNFVIPMMVGAKDLALPKVNLLSWYLYMVGGILMIYTMCVGGVDTGWTFTTPLSTHYLNTNVASAATAVFVAGFSSILTGLNFIVTIHKMRCPGMTWFRLPLFVWSNYAGALLMVLGTPVLAITLVLVVLERTVHIGVFDPNYGGDPLLFQHLFWFYSHPAVYIMILPGMGVISETISTFSRKRVFGYTAVAFSSVAIAVFAFFVWAHHMFIMGISNYSMLVFSLLTMLVAVPSAIKIFNWAFTLYKGSITFETPMLYTFGFMGLFTIGGLTGVFLASSGTDIHLTETYFIVAHFHFVMVGGMLMAFLAGIHFWWPKMTGRMYPEWIAKFAAFTIFVGFNLTFFPQFLLGYLGMPRRYHAYPEEFQV
ncbi:MAG TPA: cbb3-type cytochrome c oxidase subunit I, partial [Terracidiphilus sp.]|nr:cbb3-type cytochrome c oxidase subunit I [Terracidiphilus sp.]